LSVPKCEWAIPTAALPSSEQFLLGERYFPSVSETSIYITVMRLLIKNVTSKDFGTYKCVAKNSLGDAETSIILSSELIIFSNNIG